MSNLPGSLTGQHSLICSLGYARQQLRVVFVTRGGDVEAGGRGVGKDLREKGAGRRSRVVKAGGRGAEEDQGEKGV